MPISKKWVILIPVIAGVAALMALKQSSNPPVQEARQEQARLVRVIRAPSLTVIPTAQGHGSVRPSRTWEAVAQVKGKIVEKQPALQKGAILEAHSLILRIDPADYELAIAQSEADIQATRAQLDELAAKASNTEASLKIEQAALALNQKELARKRQLVDKGGISRSDLEVQERSLLTQQQSVQAQINTLNLFPSQKALLEAQLARHMATLASARRSLANTEIRLPFTSRIAEVNVEQGQYVREGELLVAADALDKAEIEIQIPITQMSHLVHAGRPIDVLNLDPGDALQQIGLSATATLRENGLSASWEARFARLSDTLDPKTRTVGVIVEVDEPYANVMPGRRPPLVKGLFVQVTLAGKARPDSLVVPRSALHAGRLYVVNGQQRLEIREVEVEMLQPGFATIAAGLQPGEQVVISDLVPAIQEMLLKPVQDPATEQRLARLAAGEQMP
ncbi:efflux RND transporter periplasmic adaptor subunit [Sedimenticola hydrogenitrophicus]|uniref:efflux RND transporter periplasmic adaptor subunit n=1 Tax=Sedimenticola hydrogenitrophicus TaxID=2967975 RepID=UPI0023B158AF|nr:HlyD family efflux transporter periplasmic adaptor subunit [Sedimenticola hydrogenitrophicus]